MNSINKEARIEEHPKINATKMLLAQLSDRFRVLSFYIFLVAAGCLLLARPSIAGEEIKGNLVTVTWLKKNLGNENILLLDASPDKVYKDQHIPGAISANVYAFGVRETPIVEMERLFQAVGISSGKKIIIYDQGGTMMATRLFFALYYHGFPVENLFVLDGGLFKWKEMEFPVTNEIPTNYSKGTFTIKERNENARVELPEFLNASGDLVNNVLLEALDADWHFGKTKFFDRAGHIPNAIMLPVADFFNPDKTFKSDEEIQKMLSYLGINPEQKILTHCGGGVAASVPYFALKFIGDYNNVKLYMESQMGWLSDERELPFWTYDAPFLTRETSWLQSWGGKMLRLYGIGQVSIVDVRSPEEFNQGHLPFALNIPSDEFKNHVTDPGYLTAILSLAGVNVSHEAVVISGGGLTKESALAFVLLEMLGQKKVSVFMDSMEKYIQQGFVLTKDTSAVELTNYPQNFRKDLIINDPTSTKGLYPKVFIFSGKDIQSKIQDGKVIHIPYTDFLNADGTVKAAQDIWNILIDSGVPRYAELICFSDDPGEAAVNYFILKLMGYPDLKVLIL